MKKFLIPIFVVLLLIFFYVYYTNSAGRAPVLISQNPDGTPGADVVGADIIALVEQLNTVKLDTALFAKDTFQSLRDFSISLRAQAVGRPNPFAPIGQDSQSSGASPSAREAVTVPASQEIVSEEFPETQFVDESSVDFFDESQ